MASITKLTLCLVFFFLLSFPLTLSSPLHLRSSKNTPRFLADFSRTINNSRPLKYSKYQYETRYFDQILDHFSFSDLPTFRQRYLINTEHWVGSGQLGPIFLYCGNEGDIEWFAVNTGFVWEIAPPFGAMIIFPEVTICKFYYTMY